MRLRLRYLPNSPKTSTLAVGVGYHSQTGKTGNTLTRKLFQEVTQLQSCMACLEKNAATVENDYSESSFCKACTELQSFCRGYGAVGQVSHLTPLRACIKRTSSAQMSCTHLKCGLRIWNPENGRHLQQRRQLKRNLLSCGTLYCSPWQDIQMFLEQLVSYSR